MRSPPSKPPGYQRSHSPKPGQQMIVPARNDIKLACPALSSLKLTTKSYFDFESNSGLVSPAVSILAKVRPVRVLCWDPTMGKHPLKHIDMEKDKTDLVSPEVLPTIATIVSKSPTRESIWRRGRMIFIIRIISLNSIFFVFCQRLDKNAKWQKSRHKLS